MINDLEKYELIDKYLSNELSSQEKATFENSMSSDPALSQEVDMVRSANQIVLGYGQIALVNELQQIHHNNSGGGKSGYIKGAILGVAAMISLLVPVIYQFNNSQEVIPFVSKHTPTPHFSNIQADPKTSTSYVNVDNSSSDENINTSVVYNEKDDFNKVDEFAIEVPVEIIEPEDEGLKEEVFVEVDGNKLINEFKEEAIEEKNITETVLDDQLDNVDFENINLEADNIESTPELVDETPQKEVVYQGKLNASYAITIEHALFDAKGVINIEYDSIKGGTPTYIVFVRDKENIEFKFEEYGRLEVDPGIYKISVEDKVGETFDTIVNIENRGGLASRDNSSLIEIDYNDANRNSHNFIVEEEGFTIKIMKGATIIYQNNIAYDTEFIWDGKDTYGNDLEASVYTYLIIDKNNQPIKKGDIKIIK